MKANIITIPSNTKNANICASSIERTNSELTPVIFEATTPENNLEHVREVFGRTMPWGWPKSDLDNRIDIKTSLFLKYYGEADYTKKVSCALSHARLWKECYESGESMVILEHDAVFIKKFTEEWLQTHSKDFSKVGAVGLNDPRGCTRKSGKYYEAIINNGENKLMSIPTIDSPTEGNYPHGLAGNSAYYIKPWAAKELLDKITHLGEMWPNDAIMCRQLFPWLRVCNPFFTKVQSTGTSSSTTLV